MRQSFMPLTFVPSLNLKPCLVRTFWNVLEISLSKDGVMVSRYSITVTCPYHENEPTPGVARHHQHQYIISHHTHGIIFIEKLYSNNKCKPETVICIRGMVHHSL